MFAIFSKFPNPEKLLDELAIFDDKFGDIPKFEYEPFEDLMECYKIFHKYKFNNDDEHIQLFNILSFVSNQYFALKNCSFQRRNIESVQLVDELVESCRKKNLWSETTVEKYFLGMELARNWRMFFVSYTKKNVRATNNKFFNITRRRKSGEHQLATYIVERLGTELGWDLNDQRDYFYDKSSIQTGAHWERLCKEKVETSFTLIQLVEQAIFNKEPVSENYAYREFFDFMEVRKPYLEIDNSRCAFILLDVSNKELETEVVPEYQSWKKFIRQTHQPWQPLINIKPREMETEVIPALKKHIISNANKVVNKYLSLIKENFDLN
ncbi:hypothetical protein LXM26_07610 [Dyadobacter sp. LJ419]|uniref:Uncharacterized protein n=1 Tax=Dyadobacter chenwenxiniae TaxID=2906456 RepID=A0A9X1PJL3_9BACT|nr:hypothetical protein [Dyadobacter chenwenxiniae]MCF0061354.1 hypothetical protein [Dyadobacter chenwenxiniae]